MLIGNLRSIGINLLASGTVVAGKVHVHQRVQLSVCLIRLS